MRAKNFRLLLPALVLACTATFALADDGQAAQHVAGGMPVVSDHADHAGIMPGTLVARNDNGRHEGWHKDKPRPKKHYKKGPPPGPRPGYHRPGDRPGPRPGYHRPGDRPGPRPGIHDGRGPRPDHRPDGPRPR